MGLIWNTYTKLSLGIAAFIALAFVFSIPHVIEIAVTLFGFIVGLLVGGVVRFYSRLNKVTRDVYEHDAAVGRN